jgi:hypothetical protein
MRYAILPVFAALAACSDESASGTTAAGATSSTGEQTTSSDGGATAGGGGSVQGGAGQGGAGGSIQPSGSLRFIENAPGDHEYARHVALPPTFGIGEFTLEAWVTLETKPVGTCSGAEQLINWCADDNAPYSDSSWWYTGNFLLDGHNNASFGAGTFSLQFYGGGRLRWEFGDGGDPGPGNIWSAQAYPATTTPSLIDDQPHLIAAVRRFQGVSGADLELWIDGIRVGVETTRLRTNMRSYWETWSDFPNGQEGWFWGAEKQAAIGALGQYEDFKGLLHEVRFWDIALTDAVLMNAPSTPIAGNEAGLVGRFEFAEGSGTDACDSIDSARCMSIVNADATIWAP